ncbi:hypothetical protein [Streptomyces sp. NPDC020983]|uniref:hypothetical protein n=1 Tax=Streptomyces sp. NPDC020983 TaxID=3365106 RepID=UPI0037A642E6
MSASEGLITREQVERRERRPLSNEDWDRLREAIRESTVWDVIDAILGEFENGADAL